MEKVQKPNNSEEYFSFKGSAVQIGLEHRSRGIAIVKAVTRKRLVKTLHAGKHLAYAVVICKVWNSAIIL
jgi:hypothetical protein